MKFLKRNQVAIYALALMLVVAGYMNYTSRNDINNILQTSSQEVNNTEEIGDAKLVSVEPEESNETQKNETESTVGEAIATNTNETNTKTQNTIDYFTTSKLERDTMYSQMLETYQKILNSPNLQEMQKQTAQNEITKISNTKNSIMISENLIKTKGFEDVVIFINGDSISVIVKKEKLQTEEVAQIQNIISREIKSKLENIHISCKI